jgi:hypothetical protein
MKKSTRLNLLLYRSITLMCITVFYFLLNSADVKGQSVNEISNKVEESRKDEKKLSDTVQSTEANNLPFTLQLTHIRQYMQSTQLVFKLTNNSAEMLNHFWIYVSLLDDSKGFLYREQPVLFTGIKMGSSQSIELLCESIGVDEVGYIVLKPELLEIDRQEVPFETKNVELIQPGESNAKMVFNATFR